MFATFGSLAGRAAVAIAVFAGAALTIPSPSHAQVKPPESAPRGAAGDQGQQFGDWRRQCDPPAADRPESCFVFQKLVAKESGQNLMAVAIGYYGEKQIPAAIVTVPLGVFLPAGLTLTVPDVQPTRIVVETCTQQGCRGGTQLTDEMLAALRKGSQAQLSLEDSRRRPINLPISLKGFTAGFASLKKN